MQNTEITILKTTSNQIFWILKYSDEWNAIHNFVALQASKKISSYEIIGEHVKLKKGG